MWQTALSNQTHGKPQSGEWGLLQRLTLEQLDTYYVTGTQNIKVRRQVPVLTKLAVQWEKQVCQPWPHLLC